MSESGTVTERQPSSLTRVPRQVPRRVFAMQKKARRADVQIIVEKRGFGTAVWWWRLVPETTHPKQQVLAEGERGYRGAEAAYEAAQSSLKQFQFELS